MHARNGGRQVHTKNSNRCSSSTFFLFFSFLLSLSLVAIFFNSFSTSTSFSIFSFSSWLIASNSASFLNFSFLTSSALRFLASSLFFFFSSALKLFSSFFFFFASNFCSFVRPVCTAPSRTKRHTMWAAERGPITRRCARKSARPRVGRSAAGKAVGLGGAGSGPALGQGRTLAGWGGAGREGRGTMAPGPPSSAHPRMPPGPPSAGDAPNARPPQSMRPAR